jgi:predicted transcriptional regulator
VDNDELLDAAARLDDPVFTAPELAEHVELTRRSVSGRLKKMAEDGELSRKRVGGRAAVYWLPSFEDKFSASIDWPASESQ